MTFKIVSAKPLSENQIARQKKVRPLFSSLPATHAVVRKQIDEKTFVQSTISTVGDRLNEVILPIPKDETEREEITEKVKEKIMTRAQARAEIRDIFNLGIYGN